MTDWIERTIDMVVTTAKIVKQIAWNIVSWPFKQIAALPEEVKITGSILLVMIALLIAFLIWRSIKQKQDWRFIQT